MNNKVLGERIRTRRIELGITQLQLAKSVGLTDRMINQIEVGITPIAITGQSYLGKIAVALDTTSEILQSEVLRSEQATREELQRMLKEGLILSEEELEKVFSLATQAIRRRSKANIPLNRMELLNLVEVIRGADAQ